MHRGRPAHRRANSARRRAHQPRKECSWPEATGRPLLIQLAWTAGGQRPAHQAIRIQIAEPRAASAGLRHQGEGCPPAGRPGAVEPRTGGSRLCDDALSRVASSVDNTMICSFWSTKHAELLAAAAKDGLAGRWISLWQNTSTSRFRYKATECGHHQRRCQAKKGDLMRSL